MDLLLVPKGVEVPMGLARKSPPPVAPLAVMVAVLAKNPSGLCCAVPNRPPSVFWRVGTVRVFDQQTFSVLQLAK